MHEHVLGDEWTPWKRSSDKAEKEDEEHSEGEAGSTP